MRTAAPDRRGVGLAGQPRAELIFDRAAAELGLVAQELPQPAQDLGRRIRRVDQELLQADVAGAEQQHAPGGRPSRPPRPHSW
jgi:hypothetical protein